MGKPSFPGEWGKQISTELMKSKDREGNSIRLPSPTGQSQAVTPHLQESSPQSQPERKKSDLPQSLPTLVTKKLDVLRDKGLIRPSPVHASVKPGGSMSRFIGDGKVGEREGTRRIETHHLPFSMPVGFVCSKMPPFGLPQGFSRLQLSHRALARIQNVLIIGNFIFL